MFSRNKLLACLGASGFVELVESGLVVLALEGIEDIFDEFVQVTIFR